MGRRSGHYSETEPDIVSPHASRINRGRRSGSESQRNGPTFGGPAPHSRRPNQAGGFRRGDGLHGIDDNEEMNTMFNSPGRSARPVHRGEDARAPFDGHDFARGPPHAYFEEEDSAEERVDPRRPTQPRVGRHDLFGMHENHRSGPTRVPLGAQSNRSRGGRPDIPREQQGFRDHTSRLNHIDEMDDLPLPGRAERQPFEAAGAHPGRYHPSSQRHGHVPRGRDSLRHNERPVGPRREAGNRARSLSVDAYDEPDVWPPSDPLKHRGAKIDKGRKEKEGRFIPYTFRTLPPEHAKFLAKIFQVRMSKIEEWCEADLIRLDKKLSQTNVDPLLKRVPSEDRERYEKKMQTLKNEQEIERRFGMPPRHVSNAYERGFYEGQSSALHERRSGGHGRGSHR